MLDRFNATEPLSKPKSKGLSKENCGDIRKFIQLKQHTESKRKIYSPLQTANPMPRKANKLTTPEKVPDRAFNADFSLGMSLLCDQLENSTIEEMDTPPEDEALLSPSPPLSPIIERQVMPKKLELRLSSSDDSSDEEFLSLLQRAKLKKAAKK